LWRKSLAHRTPKPYLSFMRRLAKPLTFLLIAAQLLLGVPAVAAASVSRASATAMPCDGMPCSRQCMALITPAALVAPTP
jgi:hypothetical protein